MVHGDGLYADALDAAQLERYERDGFLLLEDLLSPGEVRALAAEVERMTRDPSIMRREEAITEPGSNAVRSIFMVHVLNPVLARLTRDPRLVNVARQILGSEVYVHQSRANMKPGFRAGVLLAFGLRDLARRGQHARHAGAELLGAADRQQRQQRPVDAGAGFAPAVHFLRRPDAQQTLQAVAQEGEYGVPDPVSLQLLVEQGGIQAMTAKAGSVVFFDCNTMHGSNSNISPWPRANVFMVYNSMENTLGPPKYGLTPRPEHIATRKAFKAVTPLDALKLVGA